MQISIGEIKELLDQSKTRENADRVGHFRQWLDLSQPAKYSTDNFKAFPNNNWWIVISKIEDVSAVKCALPSTMWKIMEVYTRLNTHTKALERYAKRGTVIFMFQVIKTLLDVLIWRTHWHQDLLSSVWMQTLGTITRREFLTIVSTIRMFSIMEFYWLEWLVIIGSLRIRLELNGEKTVSWGSKWEIPVIFATMELWFWNDILIVKFFKVK